MTVVEFAEYARWAFLVMLIFFICKLIDRTVKIRIVRKMPAKPQKPAPFCEDCKWFKPKPPRSTYPDQCIHPSVFQDKLIEFPFVRREKDTTGIRPASACASCRVLKFMCGPSGRNFELRPIEQDEV